MNWLKIITDSYERKARLYPALVLIAPAVAMLAAYFAADLTALESLGAFILTSGGAFLLTQLARDKGLKGQNALFAKWGGMPSVAIFRHRDSRLDSITKARYHKKLAAMVKGAKAPTVDEEKADQAAADLVYTAWSTYVRQNTRDVKLYNLLFNENINYGYRRNVWGLRRIGMLTSAICFLITGVRFWELQHAGGGMNKELAGAFAFAMAFFGLWVFCFTSDWVRIAADAYAERLAEAVDTLQPKEGAKLG